MGWPLLETPLRMFCLYGKVMSYTSDTSLKVTILVVPEGGTVFGISRHQKGGHVMSRLPALLERTLDRYNV